MENQVATLRNGFPLYAAEQTYVDITGQRCDGPHSGIMEALQGFASIVGGSIKAIDSAMGDRRLNKHSCVMAANWEGLEKRGSHRISMSL